MYQILEMPLVTFQKYLLKCTLGFYSVFLLQCIGKWGYWHWAPVCSHATSRLVRRLSPRMTQFFWRQRFQSWCTIPLVQLLFIMLLCEHASLSVSSGMSPMLYAEENESVPPKSLYIIQGTDKLPYKQDTWESKKSEIITVHSYMCM